VSCSRGAYTEARKDLKRTAGSDANYLVDAGARILQAMRVVSLPTNFSQVLTDAILQQIDVRIQVWVGMRDKGVGSVKAWRKNCSADLP
jgi:hypothetical protein